MKNDIVSYTSISEIIDELQKIQKDHGDLPVCIAGSSPIITDVLPFYYDGGYVLQDAHNSANFIRSRTYNPEKKHTECTKGFPSSCVHLRDLAPKEYSTLEGRPVREIDQDSWQFIDLKELEERKIFKGQVAQYTYDKEVSKFKAFLDSGEFSWGDTRYEAYENLVKLYKGQQ